MVAQAGQALAWPVSDDAGIPTPVWAITNERRNSVIAFLVVIGDLCYVTSTDTETPGHHSVGPRVLIRFIKGRPVPSRVAERTDTGLLFISQ